MKPPEVLGMLEEAAGTRMYETKKEAALKTLEKKQVKVDEIDRVSHWLRPLVSVVPEEKLSFSLEISALLGQSRQYNARKLKVCLMDLNEVNSY